MVKIERIREIFDTVVSFTTGLLVMRPFSHEAGETLFGQLLVLDSLWCSCLLNRSNHKAGRPICKIQISCLIGDESTQINRPHL